MSVERRHDRLDLDLALPASCGGDEENPGNLEPVLDADTVMEPPKLLLQRLGMSLASSLETHAM